MSRITLTRAIHAPVGLVFRTVADSHGTEWDSVFAVELEEGHTLLTMIMNAHSNKLVIACSKAGKPIPALARQRTGGGNA